MKIADIIAQENYHTIKLYKQGVFGVTYEQGVYAIWKNIGYKEVQNIYRKKNCK